MASPCGMTWASPTDWKRKSLTSRHRQRPGAPLPNVSEKKGFVPAQVSEFFGSRMSSMPIGIAIIFPINGTQEESKSGISEERVMVVFYEEALKKKPQVRKFPDWIFLRKSETSPTPTPE